jgi:hypothetical protein
MVTLKTIIINAPAALRQALDRITGKMTLIRHLAALRPGPILSATASAKAALPAIARRWLTLDAEIRAHDANLEALTASCAPAMLESHGISTGTAAEMLILVEQGVAIGRRNWLFAGSRANGERAAIYSIIESCKLNGVEPFPYITDVMQKIAEGWPNSCIDELMPWMWSQSTQQKAA